jgi:signal transduction histidine kinase/ActR/RegA family two-component response regulator
MSTPPHRQDERILVLLPSEQEGALVCSAVGRAGLHCHVCADAEELARELHTGAGAVLLADEALPPPSLQLLAAWREQQPAWSDLPVLVFFGSGGETSGTSARMLDMLEPLGNVTTLERPVRVMTLVSALRSALRARRTQYQVRDLLARQEQEQRRRDEFLVRLAHELRNPLTAIRNAVHLLDRTGSQANIAVEQRGIIRRQTARITHLIGNLLAIHRVIEGRVPLRRQPVDLGALARRCLQSVVAAAGAQRVQVAADLGPDPLVVEGDPDRLEQTLCELLHNAIRHTQVGRPVGLSVRREQGEAVVRVRDGGPGIPPEQLVQLFDLFERPEADRGGEGLCVGLALVRKLAELHGGTVTATSAGTDLGSEFTLRLPLSEAPPAPPACPPSTTPGQKPSRRVLVVEDDQDGRETTRLLLQLWGHHVETAADGQQGIQKGLATRPEVALIDIGLPGSADGYDVARQLRAALGRGVLLVATTGYGEPQERELALQAGFDAHLIKPLEPDELALLLARGQVPGQVGIPAP